MLKRLGFTPDAGRDCTVKQVEAFAAKNLKELKAYVYPDAMGRKTKAQLMEALCLVFFRPEAAAKQVPLISKWSGVAA